MSSSIDFADKLFQALNVASITDLLDEYGDGKALFFSTVIPTDCEGTATINYYQIGAVDCTRPAPQGMFSVNCRAATYGEAFDIAFTVIAAVNMVSFGTFYITTQLLPVLSPADPTDVFNVPIELVLKQR